MEPRWRKGPLVGMALVTLVIVLAMSTIAAGDEPDFIGLEGQTLALHVTVDPGGPVDQYRWDFDGDGAFDVTLAQANTTHEYGEPGDYQAVLAADLHNGSVRMWIYLVRIEARNRSPEVVIVGHPSGYVETDRLTPVILDGTAVDDGTVVRYDWDFEGDGEYDWSSPTGADVNHTYGGTGTFHAVLRATDDEGATGTATITVHVANLAPVMLNQPRVSTNEPEVELNVYAQDPDGEIVTYAWTFDDGSPGVNTTDPRVNHTFPDTPGYHQVWVRVVDDDGGSSTAVIIVEITGETPFRIHKVDAGPDTTSVAGVPVQFDVNVTEGTEAIEHYYWDVTGDGSWDADARIVTYVYDQAGTYHVTVSVVDEWGIAVNDTLVVTVYPVENDPPVPVPSVEQWVRPGHALRFEEESYDPDGSIVLYQWDFDGDGRFDYASAEGGNVTHVYEEEGVYVAVLQVTDNRGEVASTSVNIRVDHDAPADGGVDDSKGAAVCCISMVVAMVAIAYWTMRRTMASPRKDGGPAEAPAEPAEAEGPPPPEGGPD